MALPPPPEGLDLTQSRVPEINGTLIGMFSLATFTLGLRMFARRLMGKKIWTEDWLTIVAWVASGVHCLVSVAYMVPHGTGKHVWVGPPEATKVWASGLFMSELAYTVTIACVKWSTLCLYWRIFATKTSIRIPIWILAGIVSAWATAVILVTLFQCVPIHAFWQRYDPFEPMKPTEFTCGVQLNPFFNGNSIPNIITDGLIVALPFPYVMQLQLRRPQKIAVMGIFLLGAFVTTVSIIRLNLILSVDLASPDITWNFNDAIIWTNIEGNTAIVCACLPVLKPLLTLALKGTLKSTNDGSKPTGGYLGSESGNKSNKGSVGITTYGGSRPGRATPGQRKGSFVSDERPFTRLNESTENYDHDDLELHSVGRESPTGAGGITVTREFKVGCTKGHAERRDDNMI